MPESNAYTGQRRGDRNAYRRYLAGMDASMRQKVALTAAHLLSEGTVADMGMGSGSGSHTLAALYPRMDFSHDTRASMIARLSAARVQLQGSSMAEIGEPVQTDTLLHVLALAQRRHSGVR